MFILLQLNVGQTKSIYRIVDRVSAYILQAEQCDDICLATTTAVALPVQHV